MISCMKRRYRLTPISRGAKLVLLALALASFSLVGCAGLQGGGKPIPPGHVRVVFTYAGNGDSVCLGGDFNNWSPSEACLHPAEDGWRTTMDLKPGKYAYGFLVDDSRWVPDPLALLFEDDGFGQKNSILIVD